MVKESWLTEFGKVEARALRNRSGHTECSVSTLARIVGRTANHRLDRSTWALIGEMLLSTGLRPLPDQVPIAGGRLTIAAFQHDALEDPAPGLWLDEPWDDMAFEHHDTLIAAADELATQFDSAEWIAAVDHLAPLRGFGRYRSTWESVLRTARPASGQGNSWQLLERATSDELGHLAHLDAALFAAMALELGIWPLVDQVLVYHHELNVLELGLTILQNAGFDRSWTAVQGAITPAAAVRVPQDILDCARRALDLDPDPTPQAIHERRRRLLLDLEAGAGTEAMAVVRKLERDRVMLAGALMELATR